MNTELSLADYLLMIANLEYYRRMYAKKQVR